MNQLYQLSLVQVPYSVGFHSEDQSFQLIGPDTDLLLRSMGDGPAERHSLRSAEALKQCGIDRAKEEGAARVRLPVCAGEVRPVNAPLQWASSCLFVP